EIATSSHSSGKLACGTTQPGSLKHWISDRTVALLKSRRNIPAGPEHNPMRRSIRRQLKESLRSNREVWWTQKVKEMEEARKAGNARRLFQLIRATGPRKPPVSESIKHQNGTTISNKEERLDRWAEYFEQQMSWPPAGTHLQPTGEVEPWTVNVEPPTASEVYDCICSLKRHRAPGPDDLPPALFKDGGEVLSQRLSDLFACIWEKESVPDNWGESVIVPIFKKGARRSGVRQEGQLSPVLFNFASDEIMRRTLEGLQNPGVQIACEENLVDLECADDIVLMLEQAENAQVFLDELTKVIAFFDFHGEKGPENIMRIDAKKDLGIWVSSNLSFALHHEKSAQKAFAVLRMIRRTFSRITRMDFQILYGAYVRPLLEYADQVVYSGRTKDVTLIERVQRAATRMVAGLKSVDYETRLVTLDLFPLECRRLRGDLILTYALFEQSLANRSAVKSTFSTFIVVTAPRGCILWIWMDNNIRSIRSIKSLDLLNSTRREDESFLNLASEEVKKLCSPLLLETSKLEELMNKLNKELDVGLSTEDDKPKELKMLNTFVKELSSQRKLIPYYSENLLFFKYVAETIYDFLLMRKLHENSFDLAVSFNFPVELRSLSTAYLIQWTKEFACDSVVGRDVCALLQEALDNLGLDVKIQAIFNDTVGVLAACAAKDPECAIGLIVSTGMNCCYFEKATRINRPFAKFAEGGELIINTECGGFGSYGSMDQFITKYDKIVDESSVAPGKQILEKMVSTLYIGELARLAILEATEKKLLFNGQLPERLAVANSFTSQFLFDIDRDPPHIYMSTEVVLRERFKITCIRKMDMVNIRYICRALVTRSGNMVGA
ncbi:hypothetical protein T265_14585, partial [Opisthorchis viverrini]